MGFFFVFFALSSKSQPCAAPWPLFAAPATSATCLSFSMCSKKSLSLAPHHEVHHQMSERQNKVLGGVWTFFCSVHPPPSSPSCSASPWRCTEWWVMCCIYDRSRLTSPCHLPSSPAEAERHAANSGAYEQQKRPTQLSSDLKTLRPSPWTWVSHLSVKISPSISHLWVALAD